MGKVIIRDRRESGFFIIDNEVLDLHDSTYKDVGPYGLLVYMVLCRHAKNGTQECSVLLNTIAKKARISRTSASRGAGELETAGLVSVERSKKKASVYILLNIPKGTVVKNEFPIETQIENEFLLGTHNNTKISNKTKTSIPASQETGKPVSKKVDPRKEEFRNIIQVVHKEKTKEDVYWEARCARQLHNLVMAKPGLTAFSLKVWLKNYWASDNINPADPPWVYLARLERYSKGALDKFGKPKTQNRYTEDDFESPGEKLRRQLNPEGNRGKEQ